MKNVRFDSSKAAAFLPEQALTSMEAAVTAARKTLLEKTGAGNDFLGWIDLPVISFAIISITWSARMSVRHRRFISQATASAVRISAI